MPSCFLYAGDEIKRGERITALNGDYAWVHQYDGNVVLYKMREGVVSWASNTAGKETTTLKFESNGDIVLFNHMTKVWQLDLSTIIRHQHGPPYVAIVQDNGEIALNDKDLNYLGGIGEGLSMHHGVFDHSKLPLGGALPWGGSIFTQGRVAAVNFNHDGDLKFQVNEGEPKPFGIKDATIMCVEDDGNLRLYNKSAKPVYDFKCGGLGGKAVMIMDNGDLVLVDDDTVMPNKADGHIIKTLVTYSSL